MPPAPQGGITYGNYKDTLFRMLFNDKKELLIRYNALNKTNYDSPEDLEKCEEYF